MGWIGIRGPAERRFRRSADPATPGAVLTRGTLRIEATALPGAVPQNLVRYATRDPRPAGVTLVLDVDGTLRLLMRRGDRTLAAAVPTGLTDSPECAILSYAWDGPARHGALTVWLPDRRILHHSHIGSPLEPSLQDARRMACGTDRITVAPSVGLMTLSDATEPAGPLPGIAAGALVETATGPRPIETLRPGDIVRTQDGGDAQIRWQGSVCLPARGRLAPMVLRAPYHGLTRDLVVTGDQRVALAGSEVEYLFGEERVAVAARHLLGRHSAEPVTPVSPLMTWHQILLDRHEVMIVNGAPVESLDARAVLTIDRKSVV